MDQTSKDHESNNLMNSSLPPIDQSLRTGKHPEQSPVKRSSLSKCRSDRRSSYLEQLQAQQSIIDQLKEIQEKEKQEITQKKKKGIVNFFTSRTADIIIAVIVGIYTLLVFLYLSFTDEEVDSSQTLTQLTLAAQIIEMGILFIFLVEIAVKIYAMGLSTYFNDRWMIFDIIIIVFSIVLIILGWVLTDSRVIRIGSILRGIFRFLRLFLVFRKFSQVKRLSSNLQRYQVKNPVEKVINILQSVARDFDDEKTIEDIKWCIEKISQNQLFDALVEKDKGDAKKWMQSLNQVQQGNSTPTSVKTTIADSIKFSISAKYDLSKDVVQELEDGIVDLSIDCFSFYERHNSKMLPILLQFLFERYSLFDRLKIDVGKLQSFGQRIADGYRDNPYHNVIHAFDVTYTMNYFISCGDFLSISNASALDLASMIISSAIHDFEHPGFNNPYVINTKHDLALKYNDKSPLENHHVAATFIILMEPNYNILKNFKREDYKYLRERIISMVLSTDMAIHFSELAKIKGRLASGEFDPKEKDKSMCMDALLHAADISNPIKPFKYYEGWVKVLFDEFWGQGDSERSLNIPVSYLCDRYTTNTAKSQIGFIDFIVLPYYQSLSLILPKLQTQIQQMDQNKQQWSGLIDRYDQLLNCLKPIEKL